LAWRGVQRDQLKTPARMEIYTPTRADEIFDNLKFSFV